MNEVAQPTEQAEAGDRTIHLLGGGVSNAVAGLSQMVGQDINVSKLNFTRIPVRDLPLLFGGPESLVVGVYLSITGHSDGHMVLLYAPQVAFDLVDLLLGQPAGTTHELSDMGQSVLGEVGNVMGSFFLNHLANSTGLEFQPSPPAVMMDMAGAVLDTTLASVLAETDYTYAIETTFGTSDRQVTGTFLVLPAPQLEAAVIEC